LDHKAEKYIFTHSGHWQELKELTKAETALAKETLSLDGLLMHVLQNKPLPVKPMRQYSVETLFFPL
jgi:hypothetical protein